MFHSHARKVRGGYGREGCGVGVVGYLCQQQSAAVLIGAEMIIMAKQNNLVCAMEVAMAMNKVTRLQIRR